MVGPAIFHPSLFTEFSPPIWNMAVFTPSQRSPFWIPSVLKKLSPSNWFLLRTKIPIFFFLAFNLFFVLYTAQGLLWSGLTMSSCLPPILACSLDLSLAFDTVDHDVLQKFVGFGDLSNWPFCLFFGVPRGLCRVPPYLLYTCYPSVNHQIKQCHCYWDDTKLYVSLEPDTTNLYYVMPCLT